MSAADGQKVPEYGRDTTSPSVSATGNNFAGAELQVFKWVERQKIVVVNNRFDSGQTLYVRWNTDAASDTDYDHVLSAGQWVTSPSGINVRKVAVYATGGPLVLGEQFSLRGWF